MGKLIRPRRHKNFMLNSTEHEIYHAHKCSNANKCWHSNIYLQDKCVIGELKIKKYLSFSAF